MIGENDADVIIAIQAKAVEVQLRIHEYEEAVDILMASLEKYTPLRKDVAIELKLAIAAPSMNALFSTIADKQVRARPFDGSVLNIMRSIVWCMQTSGYVVYAGDDLTHECGSDMLVTQVDGYRVVDDNGVTPSASTQPYEFSDRTTVTAFPKALKVERAKAALAAANAALAEAEAEAATEALAEPHGDLQVTGTQGQ
jgi:hypothetical protein